MSTLAEYLNETRRYLRDAQGDYWSDADLTASINRAMKQRDVDSGQNQLTQVVPLVIGQNEYTINTGSFNARTIGVNNIIVVLSNMRRALNERSHLEASTSFQMTETYSSWPEVFAKMSPAKVYIAPKPNQAYAAEWHTLVTAADLVAPTDADPLPYPWTDPVPLLAAHLSRLELQQYDEAEHYKTLYQQSLSDIMGGSAPMFMRSTRPGSPSRV